MKVHLPQGMRRLRDFTVVQVCIGTTREMGEKRVARSRYRVHLVS